jgi:ssRNA-specific RNase YbeY (16S rRNA maturation enzyme)
MSKSGFIVDSSKFEEKLSIEQETEIRLVNTQKIRALILQTEDPSKAANALSFYEENREYFTK